MPTYAMLRILVTLYVIIASVAIGRGGKLEKYLEVDYIDNLEKSDKAKNDTEPVPVLELGLFITSDLEEAFYLKFNTRLRGGDIFRSTLLTNYLKGLNEIYSSLSLGDVSVRIIITRLQIVKQEEWRSWKGLSSFCRYQSNFTDVDASILVILRGGPVAQQMDVLALGQTYRSGVCSRFWRCGLVQENPLLYSASRRLIAHELAHSLGLTDQGPLLKRKLLRSKSALKMANDKREPFADLSCLGAQDGLMTSRGEKWLPCSVRALRKLLRSKSAQCLYDRSGIPERPDGTYIGLIKYFNRKDMCGLYLNSTSWLSGTKVVFDSSKDSPACQFGKDECRGKYEFGGGRIRISDVSGHNWPTGTMCSRYVFDKFCYHGQCLPYDEIYARTEQFIPQE